MFSKFSYEIKEQQRTSPLVLIQKELPRINTELINLSAYIHIVLMSYKCVNIRAKKEDLITLSRTPPLVRCIYFIRDRTNSGVLLGNAFQVHYNPNSVVYIKERFSWEWNKNIGLFIQKNNLEDFFPSNNKGLLKVITTNHRRLWAT